MSKLRRRAHQLFDQKVDCSAELLPRVWFVAVSEGEVVELLLQPPLKLSSNGATAETVAAVFYTIAREWPGCSDRAILAHHWLSMSLASIAPCCPLVRHPA